MEIFIFFLFLKKKEYTNQKFFSSKIFYVFKEVSSAHQACIYLIQTTTKQIIIIMMKTAEQNLFRFLWWIESSQEQHLIKYILIIYSSRKQLL